MVTRQNGRIKLIGQPRHVFNDQAHGVVIVLFLACDGLRKRVDNEQPWAVTVLSAPVHLYQRVQVVTGAKRKFA